MIQLKFHLVFFSLFVICSSCQKDTSKEQLKIGLEKIQSRNSTLLFEKDPAKIRLPFSFHQYLIENPFGKEDVSTANLIKCSE